MFIRGMPVIPRPAFAPGYFGPSASGTISGLPAGTFTLTVPGTQRYAWLLNVTQAATPGAIAWYPNAIVAPGGAWASLFGNGSAAVSSRVSATTMRCATAIPASIVTPIMLTIDFLSGGRRYIARTNYIGASAGNDGAGMTHYGGWSDATAATFITLSNAVSSGFVAVSWWRWDNVLPPT